MKTNDSRRLFEQIDSNKDGLITFDEFKNFSSFKPELARVFLSYQELQSKHNNDLMV